ncbi:MAG: HDOD domain-containing protein [Pseudomonadota bacterium]
MTTTDNDNHVDGVNINDIRKSVEKLPMLPVVVYELMKYDPDSKDFYDVVLKLAQSDPPLATALLGYANSAAFAQHQAARISSVKSALSRVGAKRLFELLFTSSVTRVFLPHKAEHRELWQHSLQVAHFATYLAEHAKQQHVDPQQVYMAGLLHDIGRFVMLQLAPHALDKTDARGWHTAVELVDVEKQVTGHTHAEVGLTACKKIHLPRLISIAVQYHHTPEVFESRSLSNENRQLLSAIMVADELSFFLADDPKHINLAPREIKRVMVEELLNETIDTEVVALTDLCYELPKLLSKVSDIQTSLGLGS